jgi:hypothetical protein
LPVTDLEQYVDEIVRNAPRFTEQQLTRMSAIFRSAEVDTASRRRLAERAEQVRDQDTRWMSGPSRDTAATDGGWSVTTLGEAS